MKSYFLFGIMLNFSCLLYCQKTTSDHKIYVWVFKINSMNPDFNDATKKKYGTNLEEAFEELLIELNIFTLIPIKDRGKYTDYPSLNINNIKDIITDYFVDGYIDYTSDGNYTFTCKIIDSDLTKTYFTKSINLNDNDFKNKVNLKIKLKNELYKPILGKFKKEEENTKYMGENTLDTCSILKRHSYWYPITTRNFAFNELVFQKKSSKTLNRWASVISFAGILYFGTRQIHLYDKQLKAYNNAIKYPNGSEQYKHYYDEHSMYCKKSKNNLIGLIPSVTLFTIIKWDFSSKTKKFCKPK